MVGDIIPDSRAISPGILPPFYRGVIPLERQLLELESGLITLIFIELLFYENRFYQE
jgi:hypothetical protein